MTVPGDGTCPTRCTDPAMIESGPVVGAEGRRGWRPGVSTGRKSTRASVPHDWHSDCIAPLAPGARERVAPRSDEPRLPAENAMRILLVVAPSFSTHNLPVGIGTVASLCRSLGHEVKVLDLNIACWTRFRTQHGNGWNLHHPFFWNDQGRAALWENSDACAPLPAEVMAAIQEGLATVEGEQFDVVGLSLFATNLQASHLVAGFLRERLPAIRVLYGGPSVPDVFLTGGAPSPAVHRWLGSRDAAIPGEAEPVLETLLRCWEGSGGAPPSGIISVQNGRASYCPVQEPWDLARTPGVDLDDFDLTSYTLQCLPIEISRGCVGRCTFCCERNLHQGFRTRPVERVIDLLERARERQISHFNFMGSAINGDHAYFSELIAAIAARRMTIGWGGSVRLNPRMDRAHVHMMARAGCRYVNFGLESAAPAVMRRIRKQIDLGVVESFLRSAFEERIHVAMNIIAGFPGETEDDHQQTLCFLRRNGKWLTRIHVSPCQIYPGTQLHLEPARFGIRRPDPSASPGVWTTDDGGNTPAVRDRRVQEILQALDEHCVPWLAPFQPEHRSDSNGSFTERIQQLRRARRTLRQLPQPSDPA